MSENERMIFSLSIASFRFECKYTSEAFSMAKGTYRKINFQFYLRQVFCSQWQEFQVVITIDTATRGEVLPGLLVTMKGQSLHAQIGWWLGELFCFWRLLLFTASTIWTLTCWTLDTSTGTAEPPTTSLVSAQQYLFSIYLYYLHLGFGLPGQCQVGCLVAALWEK